MGVLSWALPTVDALAHPGLPVGGGGANEAGRRGHDRGEVLVDLAIAVADGATSISDPLRSWVAGMDPGAYVSDIVGTVVTAHSDK